MAFKQTPGRNSMPKTGRGLAPTLMCGSPMKQVSKEQAAATAKGRKVAESFKSNKKLNQRERDIEAAAATDSIMARKGNFTRAELADMGNKAANRTRKANESRVSVEFKGKRDKTTNDKVYEKSMSPMKQTSKEQAAAVEKGKKAAKSFKSNKKLSPREQDIEAAAASDSIMARKGNFTRAQLASMGNAAANKTRKANDSKVSVVASKKRNPVTNDIMYEKKK